MAFGYGNRRGQLRNRRLEIRVTEEEKVIVEDAASLQGQRVSDFVLPIVLEKAARVLEQGGHSVLCSADWHELVAVLKAIPNPTPPTVRLVQRLESGLRVSLPETEAYILAPSTPCAGNEQRTERDT